MLRKVFRPNALTRRVMAGLCAAFMLSVLVFSGVVVAAESDHDCSGHECPVCQEIQLCVANFQLMGSSARTDESPLPFVSFSAAEPVFCVRRASATTLQSLDVRFDE